jgi:hypothetical protein
MEASGASASPLRYTREERQSLKALGDSIDPKIRQIRRPVAAFLGGMRHDRRIEPLVETLWRAGGVPTLLQRWSEMAYAELWDRLLASAVMDAARDGENVYPWGTNVAAQVELERRREFPILMAASQATAWRLARREARARGIPRDDAIELLLAITGLGRDGLVAVVAAHEQ